MTAGEGRRWPKPQGSACGQNGRILVFCDTRGGQTVAESATVGRRPEWQEWHFVTGRGQTVVEPAMRSHAARKVGVAFRQSRGGRRWPKPQQSACGQNCRILACCEHRAGQTAPPESATVRMRPQWQWHFVSPGEGRWWSNPQRSACGQRGRSALGAPMAGEVAQWPTPQQVALREPRGRRPVDNGS